ncbi:MAG: bifunctional phosphoribosylaminoimidazolecarboxamide formyltransferase/IMP cyclohydrolase [Bacteroides graminisolvens]|jgi:phosphoribosylaminoimidazolecarboxamide formyltransferase / IMP cyclohydrolase|uniref:Bifunctional purine biosynthesis protein PurH n=2 Tax=root TaxID=1 RepID=A0A644Z4P6_9ZZZZ|nr:bifunctional phosphoribosylaminoimidazolecarboxamide formyltransferase/IMP cyclohydrolase [Bacteroides graminisolvens]MBP5978268.1 bifunctional phosphoribosylaminoimidazolecarboxamide formyltransferase/IMP cyclohydrolase [Bacteroides sp.]MBP6069556.1 bifunctional phosphoribosylaminoimidazolecarboxamide formyltransferase/IMP cyclohydrolase [Bacteroides sp.]MBP6248182.1 bifunctional phosphoribosylaminoimidazolecarboxamide formyltransferase/IMP cyclohydrolase [Bacteroides sp.]MBP7292854.1 bifun
MSGLKKIKTALVSVYHKEGLDEIITKLHEDGVEFLSTGGTRQFIESLGYPCKAVEDLTSYPSILGGRVKTLHPKVFGGILCRRELEQDRQQIEEYEIPEIDLVIVDLYPFEATVASGADEATVIEKIDIGGISLIRAAAKNYNDVVIVASQLQYKPLLDMLMEHGATSSLEERRWMAKEAFAVSSHYDSAIFNYFDGVENSAFRCSANDQKALRYGENPHQKGFFYGNLDAIFDQIHGKEISYNNLLDINAAVELIDEFEDLTFAVLKHNNACGLASRPTVLEAWKDALAGDPVSAYGGVLITNAVIDREAAAEIDKIFFEVIIAPDYDVDALEILGQKKNRIILVRKEQKLPKTQFRSLLNGVLVQERDLNIETTADLKTVTNTIPTEQEISDMLFANKIVKNSKSNAIVLAKGKQLLASGVGQTSRVDALKQAIEKAKAFGFELEGAVMASDAFFPFPDCVEIAHKEGVKAVIQPGGSVRDQQTFDYCNEHGVAMVTTGIRHFKH